MTPTTDDLLHAALAAQTRSYSPYSRFKVGAAIRSQTGRIYAGCNMENAAYPQGWCAECSAIAHMIMAGDHVISEVCVVGDGHELCTPCGGCRQKIREFANADCLVHVGNASGILKTFTLDALLPASFGPDHLK